MYKSKCFLCGQIETTFDEDLKGGDQKVKKNKNLFVAEAVF